MYGNNEGFGGGYRRPVNVGDELDVKIESVGAKGDGVAKEKGFVLFVPGAKEGDEVRIKVSKVMRNMGFAEVVGQAQGPVSQDSQDAPAQESEEAAEEPAADAQDSESFGEDSEDFGEEEEKQEDAPAESEAADAPAETSEEPASEESEEKKEE